MTKSRWGRSQWRRGFARPRFYLDPDPSTSQSSGTMNITHNAILKTDLRLRFVLERGLDVFHTLAMPAGIQAYTHLSGVAN